jgi:Uncharacterized conserved protein
MAALFPSLTGQSIEITRASSWVGGSNVITASSGKETSVAYWANPRWIWEIKFSVLRSGTRYGIERTEMQELMGFFNARRGSFDPFLYVERDDTQVIGQGLGFASAGLNVQLVRTFGAFTEPVLAPLAVSNVTSNGVPVDPSKYVFSAYGTATPGLLQFLAGAPVVAGSIIVTDIVYAWPVRFTDNDMSLDRFLNQLYSSKSVKMISKK